MGIRDLVILAVFIPLIPMSFMRAWIGILAYTWVSYMNPHRMSWNIERFHLALIIAIATILSIFAAKDRKSIPWTRELAIVAIFIVYFAITSAFAWYPDVSLEYYIEFIKTLAFAFMMTMMIYGQKRIRVFILVIIGSFGFYGVKGGIFTILTAGNNTVWGPPGSFIGGNNEIGLVLIMIVPLAAMAARTEENKWVQRSLRVTAILSAIAAIGTYSRGALLGLLVVCFFLFWQYRKYIIIAALIAPIVFLGAKKFMPQKWLERQQTMTSEEGAKGDESFMQRVQAWGVAFNVAKERPFLGGGFSYDVASITRNPQCWFDHAFFIQEWVKGNRPRPAHSIYFQVMGDHGFLALFLFILLLLSIYFRLGKLSKTNLPSEGQYIKNYAKGAQIAIAGFCISGTFLSLAYFDFLYGLVAFAAILQRESDEWQSQAITTTNGKKISKKISIASTHKKPLVPGVVKIRKLDRNRNKL
ncbi:putative O-glycosylation ligase, exosortase A system-associated [Candidatus Nitrosacidococcus tergens]|uniref:O-antigen polymerase n=1 Tax=Candidatus Nitrosacidococcus tergens TaxID=553981 RepID=A0A7G1QAL8_9GAMM|nr:putative O-glycosylation ligase, exosortase A system-associated [Candidatus Nitrosacidococcus tergens]CAB1276749.1 O-antigen polymerase [Candidatus Nitrosacidococcus tergens]